MNTHQQVLDDLKTMYSRTFNATQTLYEKARFYEQQAADLVVKSQKGEIAVSEADFLAGNALRMMALATDQARKLETEAKRLSAEIERLQSPNQSPESEADTVETDDDFYSPAIDLLKRMKEKSQQQKQVIKKKLGLDSYDVQDLEIDNALIINKKTKAQEELEKLKEQMKKQ